MTQCNNDIIYDRYYYSFRNLKPLYVIIISYCDISHNEYNYIETLYYWNSIVFHSSIWFHYTRITSIYYRYQYSIRYLKPLYVIISYCGIRYNEYNYIEILYYCNSIVIHSIWFHYKLITSIIFYHILNFGILSQIPSFENGCYAN